MPLPTRFSGEIPYFSIYLICFGSKHSRGGGSLVWKFSLCKFTDDQIYTASDVKWTFSGTCFCSTNFLTPFFFSGRLFQNAFLVYVCEMTVDIIKHSFIAKFNDIKPIAYSEYLEDLCKQVLFLTMYLFFFGLLYLTFGWGVHGGPLIWRWLEHFDVWETKSLLKILKFVSREM